MANTTQLQDIRTAALDYADMTGSGFPVDARVNGYINAALSKLHRAIADSNQDYFQSEQSISLVSGTETYALPSDYYKTLQMWHSDNSRRYKVAPYGWKQSSGYRTSPVASGTVLHWYIPDFTKLVNDTDTVQSSLPNGWEDFAALFAACRLLMREESDPSMLRAERDQLFSEILNSIEPRSYADNMAIEDSSGRWNNAESYFGNEERFIRYRILGSNISFIEFEYLGV